MMKNKKAHNRGFTLVQISALLMVASLVMVSVLPSSQKTLDANRITADRMNDLMRHYRIYMSANGKLPCPADGTLAVDSANYGIAAANSGSTTDCTGSTPAANYVDASNNVAIGMVPYKTLGIPKELVYDGWGRAITYAVDTAVTESCWSSPATGAITVTDNGSDQNTVIALVSHGVNGHGAWIPLTGSSGTGVRLNNNSSDSNELTNAHVDSSFVASSTLNNFVITTPSSTFDDLIVYKSPFWTMNAQPTIASGVSGATIVAVSGSTAGYYYSTILPQNYQASLINFVVIFDSSVTISGTPRLALTATSVGGGTVSLTGNSGSGDTGYANYVGGTGTNLLSFSYPVQSTDMAPNGLSMADSIDLNGGSITSLCTNSFTAPTLTGVVIPKVQAITASSTWTVPVDWNNTYNHVNAIGSGGNGATGNATRGGAGGGGGAHAFINPYVKAAGTSVTVTVGTGGGTSKTTFDSSGVLTADYGRNASGATAGAGGTAAASYVVATASAGGTGGNNGGTTQGGGGGGGGAGGPNGPNATAPGRNGGNGANTQGGGGGGGGANNGSGSATAGSGGTASAGKGGNGGHGYDGTGRGIGTPAGSSADGGAATAGKGAGGGGSAGRGASTAYSGTGGAGSTYNAWVTNVGSVASYGPGGGGGGSGGVSGDKSRAGGAGGGYGGGGGGSGGSNDTAGAIGAGANGLVVLTWR